MAYTPPSGVVGATWVGAEDYLGPYSVVPGAWYVPSPTIYATGFASSIVQTPPLVAEQQLVAAEGFDASVVGTPLVTFATQYRPPYSTIDVNWAGADGYTPPTATLLVTWESAEAGDPQYMYPAGAESSTVGEPITTQQQFVAPSGWGAEVFGFTTAMREGEYPPPSGLLNASWSGAAAYLPPTASVYAGWNQRAGHLSPFGWAYSATGIPDVQLRVKYVFPAAIANGVVSDAAIQNTSFGISVGGIAHPPQTGPDAQRQLPSPFVADRIRYAKPSGIAVPDAAVPTKHIIAHEIQFLDLTSRGIPSGPFGVLKFELGNRTVYPFSSLSTMFGSPNLARIQVLEPLGWSSTDVATGLRLDINLQRLLHHSGAQDQAGYGETTLRNQFENVDPLSWQSSEINFPVVYNLDQHLLVQPYAGTNSDPTQWPNYSPFVENKKRYLGPGGFISSRFSVIGNWIWNKAVPIAPEGVYGTEWGADTFIAFRIRKLGQEGWDSFYSTHYTVIYNDAEVLAPSGWSSVQYGRPDPVINLNRTVKHIFPYAGETTGTAFIAGGVRTLSPKLFYDVPAGFPEVRLNPYPISPNGMAPPQTGAAEVVERFNTFFPKSANVHPVPWVGEPAVLNRNVELRVSPSEQSLYGIPNVANYIYELTVGGDAMLTVPAPLVGYRDKPIHVTPISVPVFVTIHRVNNLLPDPPSRQLIEPMGIRVVSGVSAPILRLATIFPEGFSQYGYGQPVLTRNTLAPAPGIFNPGQFGEPVLSTAQYMYPKSLPTGVVGDSDDRWGEPRLTPHTIYAPSGDEATDQARRNHAPVGAQRIDQGINKTSNHTVTNQHRQVGQVSQLPSSRLGVPELVLRRRYVEAYPIRSLRMGYPMFLNVPQYVDLDLRHAGVGPLNAFGQHDVAPPPVPVILEARPQGLSAIGWGRTSVELFHREFSVQGIPHRGNPQQNLTNPWGMPLVGYPREYVWTAGDLSLWGTAWVSHKNRELPTEGWESLSLIDEDLGSFRDRMRVTRTNPEGAVAGIPSTAVFGTPDINFVNRTILARGIASYNSGAHAAKTFLSVTVDGWDSLEIGDIDRWEAGILKPYGDDLSRVGTPRLLHPLYVSGIVYGFFGELRVASGVSPIGMPSIGFDGPSISNPFGCTNRVLTPLPVLSQQNVPKPMVSQ